MIRIGSEYGGYLIPDNISELINAESNVISCGIGHDTTFDEELHRLTGCKVLMFDPSSVARKHIDEKKYDWATFIQVAVSGKTGPIDIYEPEDNKHDSWSINNAGIKRIVASLKISDICQSQAVDLLKLDIEGCELDVIMNMIIFSIKPKILCIEIHKEIEEPVIIELLHDYSYEKSDKTFTFVLKK